MKLTLILIAAALVIVTFVADYKWRKWMAERKRDRQLLARNPFRCSAFATSPHLSRYNGADGAV